MHPEGVGGASSCKQWQAGRRGPVQLLTGKSPAARAARDDSSRLGRQAGRQEHAEGGGLGSRSYGMATRSSSPARCCLPHRLLCSSPLAALARCWAAAACSRYDSLLLLRTAPQHGTPPHLRLGCCDRPPTHSLPALPTPLLTAALARSWIAVELVVPWLACAWLWMSPALGGAPAPLSDWVLSWLAAETDLICRQGVRQRGGSCRWAGEREQGGPGLWSKGAELAGPRGGPDLQTRGAPARCFMSVGRMRGSKAAMRQCKGAGS